MKKLLLTLAVMLVSAAAANAAVVYFSNTNNWDKVYSYCWTPNDPTPFTELTAENIDGHTLYKRDTGTKTKIIFLNNSEWDNQLQTGDLDAIDGAVYNASSEHIADIVDGSYVAISDPNPVEHTGIFLRGTMNDWGTPSNYEFTKEGENIYQLKATLLTGTQFKIAAAAWGENSWGGASGETLSISPDGEYTLTAGPSSTNMVAAVDMFDVTITFNSSTRVMNISASGEAQDIKWYCAWDLNDGNGWQFGNEFEKQEEGTYKVVVTTPSNTGENYFAVFQGINNTGWNDGATRYYPEGNGDVEVTEDGTYPMQTGSNGAWMLTQNGEWTVVIDPRDQANTTISFDWGNSIGEANVLIDRANDDDHSYKSYAMTEVTGDTNAYSWTGTLAVGDKLMFNIHGENYYYDPSVGTITKHEDGTDGHTLEIEYPLNQGDGEVTFNYSADVTIVVDIDETKVTVTIANAPYATITITNGENNSITRLVNQGNGIYRSQITLNPGDCIDFRVHDTRYAPDFNSPVVENGVTYYPIAESDDSEAAPEFTSLSETKTVYVQVNTNTNRVSFTQDIVTGVEAIEADDAEAVYYNLQGIRVDQPANGMFIMVKGNKAVKVAK